MKVSLGLCAAVLVGALGVGTLVGCGGQLETPVGEPAATTTETGASTAEVTQTDPIGNLKSALASMPVFSSVTATEFEKTVAKGGDKGANVEGTTVYRFDESGETLRASADVEVSGATMRYVTDGDDAVCVSDGLVYAGTTDQFELAFAKGFDAYVKDAFGDFGTIVDCASSATVGQQDGIAVYTLTLDPERYARSDEALTMAAEIAPVKSAVVSFGFNQEGRLVTLRSYVEHDMSTIETNIAFTEYDATVVEDLPEATSTFEEWEYDRQAKLDETAPVLEDEDELIDYGEGEDELASDAEAEDEVA